MNKELAGTIGILTSIFILSWATSWKVSVGTFVVSLIIFVIGRCKD